MYVKYQGQEEEEAETEPREGFVLTSLGPFLITR